MTSTSPKTARPGSDTAASSWATLYILGALGALFSFVLIPVQLIVFSTTPEPTTALGWFTLFQDNKLQGLLSFEILFAINSAFSVATALALYVALRHVSPSWMAIFLAFSLVGAVCIVIARPAIDMLYLSDQYAAATDDAQRALFLAAGETLVALRHGMAFHVSYNLANIGLLIAPLVMLRTNIFNKVTAYAGILSGVIAFGLYVPDIGIYISVISVLFYAVWLILIALKLWQLGRAS
ncbi:MAG: DUF4386 family protein [Anaerolineae bacterium]|nr:DUF4386 family protein [Anaerolineae bacterium]